MSHISTDKLLGFLNETLTDAEREHITMHVATCASCRTRLDALRREREVIVGHINETMSEAKTTASFTEIADKLPQRRRRARWQNVATTRLIPTAAAFAALFIIGFAVYGLLSPTGEPAPPSETKAEPTESPLDGMIFQNEPFEDEQEPDQLSPAPRIEDLNFNQDFERVTNRPVMWFLTGATFLYYEVSTSDDATSGEKSALIESVDPAAVNNEVALSQGLDVSDFTGQRVRVSADIKTENVTNRAGLWVKLTNSQQIPLVTYTTADRPISGTTDWQRIETVFDISSGARTLDLGLLLFGEGKAWIDNVQIEQVDVSVPTTANIFSNRAYVNPDFEDWSGNRPTGWAAAVANPEIYAVEKDTTTFTSGATSVTLYNRLDVTDDETFDFVSQYVDGMEDFVGKRVRYSADVKTENVADFAGLWMRVDGSLERSEILAFDDMSNRPITGTTEWMRYEVVLDISESSVGIQYGVALSGEGRLWFDNVTWEIVGDDVPTTDLESP